MEKLIKKKNLSKLHIVCVFFLKNDMYYLFYFSNYHTLVDCVIFFSVLKCLTTNASYWIGVNCLGTIMIEIDFEDYTCQDLYFRS